MAKQAVEFLKEGNFEKSISTSRQVLHYATNSNDNSLIAVSYNIIAANLDELSETDKAISYYNKGLFYADKTDNDTIKNYINNNLGNIYCFEKKQYEKGIYYFKKSLVYSQKTNDRAQILFTKLNITWAYFDIGLFTKGMPYLEYVNKNQSKFGKSATESCLNMLNGMYFSNKGDKSKAEYYFINAIKLGKINKDKSDLSYSHLEYSKFLFKNKDFEKAYHNLVLYNKIKDEIYATDKLNKANVAGVNVELDEYKREVNKIEVENKLQSENLRKSLIIVFLFIVVLITLLFFFFSLYKNYNYKKKINKELLLTNHELIIAKEKAEEADHVKTQFISTMSHELRTPLYGVIGITNMLLDEHKELENSPHLFSLKFSAKYLLSLVNDILHINKIEEKKVDLESFVFNISDEIRLIKNSLSFLAKNNNNTIELTIDPSIPEYLIGDKLRLSQILINLIGNALKFTKAGVIEIHVKLQKVEFTSNYIEFIIKDNGVGIAAKDLDKIFDKFVQVGRNENDYQGTGLGLAIVKRLLELFNSEILVESEIGYGSTFKFTIAFVHDPAKTIEFINNINVDLSSGEIYRVLVVEDNKINQMITQRIIEKNNGNCTLVDDGFQAIEILDKEDFDIILMDINMPLMNGFETTRKIRQKGIETPIIALTAFAKDEITEEAISAGMNDIMIKPFEALNLFQVINYQIYNAKNTVQ
ncbi:tetratricopeptide repeat-containing hybrid sensor histidine kinase/response regulator [Flavobacterium cellulosilyticum]|nr:response regulator [Flavobacterium cellulosilyticum]